MGSISLVALLALCAVSALALPPRPLKIKDRIGSVSVTGSNTEVADTINNNEDSFGRPSRPSRPASDFPMDEPQPEMTDFKPPSRPRMPPPSRRPSGHGIEHVDVHGDNTEVADELNNFGRRRHKPVMEMSQNEEQYMRAAVEDVVNKDPLVPEEKKKEATDFAVKQMKEGFQKSNMTHDRLVNIVEAEAAKRNATELPPHEAKQALTDRAYGGHYGGHYGGYGYGHRGYGGYYGGYYPSYYPGYGYNNCMYSSSYGYCQQQLYGDYAYYGGYHNYYRHPYHRYREDSEDLTEQKYRSDSEELTGKKYRSDPTIFKTELKSYRLDEPQLNNGTILKNLTSASSKTKSAAASDRLDKAVKHADRVQELVTKAADSKLISREDAKDIKESASQVKKAAKVGDRETAMERAEEMHDRVVSAVKNRDENRVGLI